MDSVLERVYKVSFNQTNPNSEYLSIFTVPFIAVQVVLQAKDMPTGNAIAIFFNSLGGAVAISIAQNIFSNGLRTYLPIDAPGVDVDTVIAAGASYLRKAVTAAQLPGVLLAYMNALKQAYIMSIAVAGLVRLFPSCSMFPSSRAFRMNDFLRA